MLAALPCSVLGSACPGRAGTLRAGALALAPVCSSRFGTVALAPIHLRPCRLGPDVFLHNASNIPHA